MADASDEAASGRLKVFVSYSRADIEFADQLVMALEDKGFEPLLDRHDIDAAENWRARLGGLIASCDTVVFVLTEASAGSDICAWEVAESARLGKRLIPVVPRAFERAPPPALAELNYIHFYTAPALPGSGFYDGVRKLDRALRVNLDWLRRQTRLSEQAAEWAREKSDDLLLRGAALAEAASWRAQAPAGAKLHDAVRAFLDASEAAEEQRKAEASAQIAEREATLAEKEQAVAARAKADALARRATRIGIAVALALTLIAAGGNWIAWQATAQASRNRAGLFVRESLALDGPDGPAAILMALYGDPAAQRGWVERLSDGAGYPVARNALVTAVTRNQVERFWRLAPGAKITSLALAGDGSQMLVGATDGMASQWRTARWSPRSTTAT